MLRRKHRGSRPKREVGVDGPPEAPAEPEDAQAALEAVAAATEPKVLLPEEVGIPPLPVPFDLPPPEAIPPAAPGEKPDKADDTANVNYDTLVWLKACKAILLAEGFKREPLRQARKLGMVWGVVRQEPDDMQIHVRAFKDGRLESEVELSNRFVQHLWSHRRGAHVEVKEILARHRMPTHRVSETFLPMTGTKAGKKMPRGRTRANHVYAAVFVGIAVMLGKAYLKRVILKRR